MIESKQNARGIIVEQQQREARTGLPADVLTFLNEVADSKRFPFPAHATNVEELGAAALDLLKKYGEVAAMIEPVQGSGATAEPSAEPAGWRPIESAPRDE